MALSLMVLATAAFLRANRPSLDLSAATFEVRWAPVRVPPTEGLQAKIAGAWALTALDPRAGGFSGLAVDGDRLLGLTDGGMLVWLPIPPASGRATIRPLPAVAGNPRTKIGRDSEAITRAADGWWVAFEQVHQLVRYDSAFARASRRIAIRHRDFRPNRGAEAIVAGSRLIAYPESSGISDAAVTSDGEIALLKRRFGVGGFRSRISGIAGGEVALPLRPLDNPEGLAAQALPGGGTRLWVITDNDQRRWKRTLLVAVDVPARSGD